MLFYHRLYVAELVHNALDVGHDFCELLFSLRDHKLRFLFFLGLGFSRFVTFSPITANVVTPTGLRRGRFNYF